MNVLGVDRIEDLIREAASTLEWGNVCVDVGAIKPDAVRGIAYDNIGLYAVVTVLLRVAADGQPFHQVNVFLLKDDDGRWRAPEGVLFGNPREYADFRRPSKDGASRLSGGSWGRAPLSESAGELPSHPSTVWTWVSGIAGRSVAAVEVQSALATRTRPVVAESGAFVVLVEARGDEMVSCQGRTDDGRPVSLEAPPHGFGAR